MSTIALFQWPVFWRLTSKTLHDFFHSSQMTSVQHSSFGYLRYHWFIAAQSISGRRSVSSALGSPKEKSSAPLHSPNRRCNRSDVRLAPMVMGDTSWSTEKCMPYGPKSFLESIFLNRKTSKSLTGRQGVLGHWLPLRQWTWSCGLDGYQEWEKHIPRELTAFLGLTWCPENWSLRGTRRWTAALWCVERKTVSDVEFWEVPETGKLG